MRNSNSLIDRIGIAHKLTSWDANQEEFLLLAEKSETKFTPVNKSQYQSWEVIDRFLKIEYRDGSQIIAGLIRVANSFCNLFGLIGFLNCENRYIGELT